MFREQIKTITTFFSNKPTSFANFQTEYYLNTLKVTRLEEYETRRSVILMILRLFMCTFITEAYKCIPKLSRYI